MALAHERNTELSELVNKFVLRRTNAILSKHLPPKVVEVVICRLSDLQTRQGLIQTSTRPTLHLLLLLRASV